MLEVDEPLYADSGQSGEIWVRSEEGERGFVYLCDGVAGGPQGCPLTNLFFPLAIDSALKATEAMYPGVEPQDIMNVLKARQVARGHPRFF